MEGKERKIMFKILDFWLSLYQLLNPSVLPYNPIRLG
jgi:hypothetical protein